MPARDSRQRRTGSYYTPEWLARWMVRRTLSGFTRVQALQATFLDPACGDGAFLLTLLEELEQLTLTTVSDRRNLVRRSLFGVDADPVAIESLRDRVVRSIGSEPTVSDVDRVLRTNLLCGDALLGRGLSSDESDSSPDGIDWPTAFPKAAEQGGFDVVIGNPPYRRERYAKADFDRICSTPWGQRWRRPRMDLWHFFAHRGLELLKPGGTLTFIVNSYWMESTAAATLRERIHRELALEEIVLLGDAKLFPGVAGRHMIFRGRKLVLSHSPPASVGTFDQDIHSTTTAADCQVIDLSGCSAEEQSRILSQNVLGEAHIDDSFQTRITQQKLWHRGRLQLPRLGRSGRNGATRQTASGKSLPNEGPQLGDLFLVRQGIAENPPFVTKAIANELGTGFHVGQGVFVLTDEELAKLNLNDSERRLVCPYYALSSLGRFQVAKQPTHWLLYLTRETAQSLEVFPKLAAHLTPFRPVLERRREVKTGSIAWWHLHWPRTPHLFTAPRVLCVQMGRVPQFVFVEKPTFVGFSAHVIVAKPEDEHHAQPGSDSTCQAVRRPSLPALSAILNSSPAKGWFEDHAKHRGVHLDISGTVLKRFPLPRFLTEELNFSLSQLAERLATNDQSDHTPDNGSLEMDLDRLVSAAYAESMCRRLAESH